MQYHIEPYSNNTENNSIVIENQNIAGKGIKTKLSRSFQAH